MKQLSRLAAGCCCLLCLSGALPAEEANDDTTSDKDVGSSVNLNLSPEEVQYIRQECESFAEEDDISKELRPDYIETCVGELSVAVKNAIEKLQNNLESTASESENLTTKD